MGATLSIPLKRSVFTGEEKVTKGTNANCADSVYAQFAAKHRHRDMAIAGRAREVTEADRTAADISTRLLLH